MRGLVLLALLNACAPAPVPARPPSIGDHVPGFEAPDTHGRVHRLSDYLGPGRTLMLTFWSARCPCSAQCDEELSRIARELAGKGVRVVAVASNADEPPSLVRQVQRERELPFPVLIDRGARLARRLGAQATPTTMLIDAAGRLRYRGEFERIDRKALKDPDFELGGVSFRMLEPGEAPAPPPPPKRWAIEALDALLAGREPDPAEVPAEGCAIVHEAL